jgi:hypothetical protein
MRARARWVALAAEGSTRGTYARCAMRFLLGLAALVLLLPAPVRAQESGGIDGPAPVEAMADPAADRSDVQPTAPAGELFVAPRSGRAYSHVFLAFGIAWALMLGFVVVLGRRFAAVERDLARLGDRDP